MTKPSQVVVLTGPAAAGKNAIAAETGALLPALAVIDVDQVRWMVVKPHVAPWGGEEGQRQQELGVRNACALTRNFIDADLPILILDVLTDRTARLYRNLLHGHTPCIVQLMPEWDTVEARRTTRPQSITAEEARLLYEWQQRLTDVDVRIDNTTRSAAEVARDVVSLFSPPDTRT